jgi:hypothetical protein
MLTDQMRENRALFNLARGDRSWPQLRCASVDQATLERLTTGGHVSANGHFSLTPAGLRELQARLSSGRASTITYGSSS